MCQLLAILGKYILLFLSLLYSVLLGNANFIGSLSFYVLGNPSFWIFMLFPAELFMYVAGWLYILKYAVAGLTAYLWIRQYVKEDMQLLLLLCMHFQGL